MKPSNRRMHTALPILLTVVASCAHDPAEREYLAALRGEEEGMSRQEQIVRLDRAIALQPGRVHFWETRSIYRIDLRDFEHARADLDQAIRLHERPYLHFLRGLVLCESGHPAEAIPDFDAAISGQPENAQFYRGLALARVAVGRPQEALEDAARLIALSSQTAESYYARGIALAKLGRDREAIDDFTESLRRRPELVYPLRARADFYQRANLPERAAVDRAEATKRENQHRSCAPCVDPLRY